MNLFNWEHLVSTSRNVCEPFYSDAIAVVPVPNKGKGVRATRKVRKGELLLVEPALAFHESCASIEKRMEKDLKLAEQLASLKDWRSCFFGPSNVFEPPTRPQDLRFMLEGGALFYCASFFNHDCVPSAFDVFVNNVIVIVASRDVDPGEELTIAYVSRDYSFPERSVRLFEGWNFLCTCRLCVQEKALVNEIEEVQRMTDHLLNMMRQSVCLHGNHMLRKALERAKALPNKKLVRILETAEAFSHEKVGDVKAAAKCWSGVDFSDETMLGEVAYSFVKISSLFEMTNQPQIAALWRKKALDNLCRYLPQSLAQITYLELLKACYKMSSLPVPNSIADNTLRCLQCHDSNKELKRCSQCKAVFFCDEHCQKVAWSAHKSVCKFQKV
jgi:hypothetical protein